MQPLLDRLRQYQPHRPLRGSLFVFKGGMITSALLFFLSWLLTRYWLLQIGSKSPNAAMVLLAFLGSLALILYTLALGHHGDSFELLRRGGVMFFIFATFMCQVLMAKQLLEIESMSHYGKTLLRFSAFMLAVGIVSLILEGTVNDFHDRLKNAIEWWVILWLNVHLLLTVVLWKKTGFSLDVTIR